MLNVAVRLYFCFCLVRTLINMVESNDNKDVKNPWSRLSL